MELFLQFALEDGAIDAEEKTLLAQRAWKALMQAASAQLKLQANEDPVERFLELLDGALAGGFAYVADPEDGNGSVAGAHQVGWKDKENVLLEPQTAFALVQKLGKDQNEPLPIGQKTLWKRLKSKGYLARHDPGRNQLMWRGRRVICLTPDALPSVRISAAEKGKAASLF